MSVVSTFNAGFFSCCSVKLFNIIEFIKKEKKLPAYVDSSQQFELYKSNPDKDVTYDFFENYSSISIDFHSINTKKINFNPLMHIGNYSNINFKHLLPLVKKYFSSSKKVNDQIDLLKDKYKIEPENCIGVYYRGTDKSKETPVGTFDDFFLGVIKIIEENPTKSIIIQSDSKEFIDFIKKKNLNNAIFISDNVCSKTNMGIHNEQVGFQNYEQMFNLFATFLILSECKYIVCNSGNCSLWMMLYRGNNDNVLQFLNLKWFVSKFDINLHSFPLADNNDPSNHLNFKKFKKKMNAKKKIFL